jgi:hypothetical protein
VDPRLRREAAGAGVHGVRRALDRGVCRREVRAIGLGTAARRRGSMPDLRSGGPEVATRRGRRRPALPS